MIKNNIKKAIELFYKFGKVSYAQNIFDKLINKTLRIYDSMMKG